jgi:hypothetical protein
MKILAAVAAIIFLFAAGATAETTNDLSDAEIQGRNLVQQLLEQTPAKKFTQNGYLKVKVFQGKTIEIPLKFITFVTPTNWQNIYVASKSNGVETLFVIHATDQNNQYFYCPWPGDKPVPSSAFRTNGLSSTDTMTPFADSDFWIADLGLEFFHWPEQKILKHEMKRGRSCQVLESTNPNPSTNGYSRVVSWIDNETLGIVHAEAYDFKNKLLKEFDPKSFKKVNGQWELQEMEIRDDQTGSRTRLEFDVKKE